MRRGESVEDMKFLKIPENVFWYKIYHKIGYF